MRYETTMISPMTRTCAPIAIGKAHLLRSSGLAFVLSSIVSNIDFPRVSRVYLTGFGLGGLRLADVDRPLLVLIRLGDCLAGLRVLPDRGQRLRLFAIDQIDVRQGIEVVGVDGQRLFER